MSLFPLSFNTSRYFRQMSAFNNSSVTQGHSRMALMVIQLGTDPRGTYENAWVLLGDTDHEKWVLNIR